MEIHTIQEFIQEFYLCICSVDDLGSQAKVLSGTSNLILGAFYGSMI